jgi:hypothetical protein
VSIVEATFYTTSQKGREIANAVELEYVDGRIEFPGLPFEFKDEIKSMAGSRWMQYVEGDGRKLWSIKDCQRNRIQLAFLQGENPLEWFDREVVEHKYDRPLRQHQREMADIVLTYHFHILAADPGLGKTLTAIEVMERSGHGNWWWVGPKRPLEAAKLEFNEWNLDRAIRENLRLFTYEGLVSHIKSTGESPDGIVFDESHGLMYDTTKRSQAAQEVADRIRDKHGLNGYVLMLSGTPSPKSPAGWWSQCEIAFPGFLKEGSVKAFRERLAVMKKKQFGLGGVHNDLVTWRDNPNKCNVCGQFQDDPNHSAVDAVKGEYHRFVPSKNEVELIFTRTKGLVTKKLKKNCVDLPDKVYHTIRCEPTASVLRVAKAIVDTQVHTITGMILLRELSDGFQYREKQDGMMPCDHCGATGEVQEWYDPSDAEGQTYNSVDMFDAEFVASLEKRTAVCPQCDGSHEIPKMVRDIYEVPCPKEPVLKEILEKYEAHGRIIVFAAFEGSVERVMRICLGEGWDVVRCDGSQFRAFKRNPDGTVETQHKTPPLEYWGDTENNQKVAFVANPESGGQGLNLTEACALVWWSNSFKPQFRLQGEDRIHRMGMDENLGAAIYDIIHLPTDERVLQVIRENRKLELMSLGELTSNIEWGK